MYFLVENEKLVAVSLTEARAQSRMGKTILAPVKVEKRGRPRRNLTPVEIRQIFDVYINTASAYAVRHAIGPKISVGGVSRILADPECRQHISPEKLETVDALRRRCGRGASKK